MTISEVIQDIEAAMVKQDFMYELTPANKEFLSRAMEKDIYIDEFDVRETVFDGRGMEN